MTIFQPNNGYVDESGTNDAKPVIAIASWLSTYEAWVAFENEWSKKVAPFGGDFHSTDFWARQDYGAHWSDLKRLTFVKELAGIICKYPLYGFAIGFVKADYNSALPKEIRLHFKNDPYYYCVGGLMSFLLTRYERIPLNSRPPKPLRFMFDSKRGGQGYATQVYYQVKEWFDRDEVLGEIGFGKRQQEPALQAADLLVGEVRRFFEGSQSEVLELLRAKSRGLVFATPRISELKVRAQELLQQMRRS